MSATTGTSSRRSTSTVRLNEMFRQESRAEAIATKVEDQPYSDEALQAAWMAFAERRKSFQAEYQLLSGGFQREGDQLTVLLANPVQEVMLNNVKTELCTELRRVLKNNKITLTGVLQEGEEKQVLYTAREKFEYLVTTNPILRELKERLGLDTDY